MPIFQFRKKASPNELEIVEGWQKHKMKMKSVSSQIGLPILFTECGYRSIDFAAEKPWDYSRDKKVVNEHLQARLLKVMFDDVWSEDWCAGGYIWKWFPDHLNSGGPEDAQFTPQNKLAQKTISSKFATFLSR